MESSPELPVEGGGSPPGRSNGRGRGLFAGYETLPGGYDEAFARAGELRPGVRRVLSQLDELGPEEFLRRRARADDAFLRHGVTFTLYSEGDGSQERIFPRLPD